LDNSYVAVYVACAGVFGASSSPFGALDPNSQALKPEQN
jgi:hypothetical protein